MQHALDLDHDLGHLDGPAQPGQLPDAQPAVGGDQDQGAVARLDRVDQGGDLGRVMELTLVGRRAYELLAQVWAEGNGKAVARGATFTLRCRPGSCTRPARWLACSSGCHLVACAVKGRCALLSARSALRAVP